MNTNRVAKMLLAVFNVSIVVFGVLMFSTDASGQSPTPAAELSYEEILDKVFPLDTRVGQETEMTIALRFRPSFSPETAITLRFDHEGAATIDYITAGSRIIEIVRSHPAGSLDADALKKILKVEQSTQRLDSRAGKKLLKDLWDALPRSISYTKQNLGYVQLDGTKYEIYLSTGLTQWHVTVSDDEVEAKPNGSASVVRWMNSLRLSLQNSPSIAN
jgi:hypothetical protein